MFKIVYWEGSIEDLKQIFHYIAQDNPFYGTEVVNKIYDSIELLEIFPYIWKERKDNIREIVEPQYKFRIFYKINDKEIHIISIFKWKNL